MLDYIKKGNIALILFGLKGLGIEDKEKEMKVWTKLIDSFHFDDDVTFNLIYIKHPMEDFIGISLKFIDCSLMEKKIIRYSEGLAHLMTYYFEDADIRLLSEEEQITVVSNLCNLDQIPLNLCSCESAYLKGSNDKMQFVFARIVDPKIILEKFYQFCVSYKKQNGNSIESRIGAKPNFDERLFNILQNAFLGYSFKYYPSKDQVDKDISQSQTCDIPRESIFIKDFIEEMGVPDEFVDKIHACKYCYEMFDNPDLVLVSAETVAKFILGYK